MEVAVVIPAYQPGEVLVGLIRSLVESPIESIIVIDDGSGPGYQHLFKQAGSLPRVTVLRHERNLGKGAALKTGINYVVSNFPQYAGVITADADGQHEPADIVAVARAFTAHPDSMVLGSREFRRDVPWKSLLGNRITRQLVRVLVGRYLSDTQTGLRAIPAGLFPALVKIHSTGYEFELDMLIAAKHRRVPIIEQTIKTVYEPGNPTSHFNPLVDSLKITFVLLRFSSVSLVTAIIDNTVFILAFKATGQVITAQVAARTAATCFNYPAGRRAVFLSDGKHRVLLPRYLGLVALMGTLSYFLMNFILNPAIHNIFVSKILGEGILFVFSFVVQRDFVFSRARV
jgi:glycosyltransferase involved in cell wall biosynthesis